MTYRPFPKYKCAQIAREVTNHLHLTPGLEWWQVKDFYEPRLPGIEPAYITRYDEHTRGLIVRALERELRYQHVRRP